MGVIDAGSARKGPWETLATSQNLRFWKNLERGLSSTASRCAKWRRCISQLWVDSHDSDSAQTILWQARSKTLLGLSITGMSWRDFGAQLAWSGKGDRKRNVE